MANNNKVRVILDTNLWISFLISKRLRSIDRLFKSDRIRLVFSQELLDEVTEVSQRPKFKKYFSLDVVEDLFRLFDVYGEMVQVTSKVDLCRDEKDNFLLALSKDGRADYLITGDADLLVIKKFEQTEILTYTEFSVKTTGFV